MPRIALSVAALLALTANFAQAQSIEFRIIERQGQTVIPNPVGMTPTTDAVLNFAVQARVTGGTATQGIGEFHFDMVASGESDSRGTLSRLLTSNSDGTYAANTAQSTNGTIGRGGLAAQYAYLATTNPNFNGLINTSGGTFTNTPGSQEIGLIGGRAAGAGLLLQSDADMDGNPDTYPGSGTTAPLDPNYASTYLGAGGNFVDVYRFKYTVTDINTCRFPSFGLANVSAQLATGLQLANGVWQPVQVPVQSSSSGVTIFVTFCPSPGTAPLGAIAAFALARRKRP